VHAPTEDKSDGTKDWFYKKLEHVWSIPKYHMKILLRDWFYKKLKHVF